MKNVLTYITLIIFFVLQTTVCRYFQILHIFPNLILVFVICYSMHAEPVKAAVLAAVAGILMDLFQARHLGINAIMMMYLGLCLSCISSDYIRTNVFTVFVSAAVSTFVYEIIYGFLVYFIFGKVSALDLIRISGIESIYNSVIAIAVMWLARYLAYDEVRSL